MIFIKLFFIISLLIKPISKNLDIQHKNNQNNNFNSVNKNNEIYNYPNENGEYYEDKIIPYNGVSGIKEHSFKILDFEVCNDFTKEDITYDFFIKFLRPSSTYRIQLFYYTFYHGYYVMNTTIFNSSNFNYTHVKYFRAKVPKKDCEYDLLRFGIYVYCYKNLNANYTDFLIEEQRLIIRLDRYYQKYKPENKLYKLPYRAKYISDINTLRTFYDYIGFSNYEKNDLYNLYFRINFRKYIFNLKGLNNNKIVKIYIENGEQYFGNIFEYDVNKKPYLKGKIIRNNKTNTGYIDLILPDVYVNLFTNKMSNHKFSKYYLKAHYLYLPYSKYKKDLNIKFAIIFNDYGKGRHEFSWDINYGFLNLISEYYDVNSYEDKVVEDFNDNEVII